MKKLTIITSILILTILLSAAVSAQWGYGRWSYTSPADILNNEWVVFVIIFLVFFAVIFFSLAKTFKENKGVAVIVAGAIALAISAVIARRVSFYGFIGEDLGGWLILVAFAVLIIFFIKALYDTLGGIGLTIGAILSWLILRYFDWELFLPYSITENPIFTLAQSWVIGIIIFIVAVIIAVNYKKLRKREDEIILRR